MKALFVDNDPVNRGVIHCLATMAGINHAIVSTAGEALAVLRGEAELAPGDWNLDTRAADNNIGVVVTDLSLPDMDGEELAREIRTSHPQTMIFANTLPEFLRGGELFERVFFKPRGNEDMMQAVLGVLGTVSECDLFRAMIPSAKFHAA
jgi:CheY-like chemotaxis protein